MTRLAKAIRSAGLMPLVKPVAERAAGMKGMRIVPADQVPNVSWPGLPNLPIRTVLDIGACRGGFATEILRPRFPNAVIHSFEPSSDAIPRLKAKADASGGRQVVHNFGGRVLYYDAVFIRPATEGRT